MPPSPLLQDVNRSDEPQELKTIDPGLEHSSTSLGDETSTFETKKEEAPKQDASVSKPAPPGVPDGGLQAWMTVAGAFIVVFSSSGYVNSFGVYEDFYVREYLSTFSSSQISWIGAAQTFCLFSCGIFSGFAMDIGYFRPVMWAGSALFTFCLFMISITKEEQWYQVFLAQGIGLGLAIGSIYIPSLGVVAHHFSRKRSLVMGIVASGSSLGGVVHPIMLNSLIHNPRVGFHWAVRASAFFNLGLLLIANFMMTTRLPPQDKTLPAQIRIWAGFLKDKTYMTGNAGTFLLITGVFFPIFYLQLDSVVHGVDTNFAFYSIAILNGASLFGRIIPNMIADRLGVFTLIVPCTLACGVLIFSMVGLVNAAGAVVLAILYGFFSGACISLLGPMIANMSRTVTEVGARIGVSFGLGAYGTLIGPPIQGALLTSKLIWIRPIIFSGICMAAGAGMLALAGVLVWRDKHAAEARKRTSHISFERA